MAPSKLLNIDNSNQFWEPSSKIFKGSHQIFFYECLGHGSYFQIFIFVFFADPSWWLQMAPGAAQKSWILGKPLLWRLLEPSTCHVSKIFFQIWALTDLNILNPEGHICSHQGRTRPDGSNIWIFTSCSKFLQWLGGTAHIYTGHHFDWSRFKAFNITIFICISVFHCYMHQVLTQYIVST